MKKEEVGGINVLIVGNKCFRCEHSWIPRNTEQPETCPKCKSPYWSKPRKNNKEKKR